MDPTATWMYLYFVDFVCSTWVEYTCDLLVQRFSEALHDNSATSVLQVCTVSITLITKPCGLCQICLKFNVLSETCPLSITLGPVYNEFNEHPAATSGFLCIKIIDCYVQKFGYYEHQLTTKSFFHIYLLVVSGTKCLCCP